jgi:hypothetical protein
MKQVDGIDLFKEYIVYRERKFLHYDEHQRGFIVYSYPCRNHEECFIDDMFLLDSERELKIVMGMIKHVEGEARAYGKQYLTGAINIKKPDADRLLKAHLWHGMKPIGTNGEFIYMGKEL